MVQARFSSSIAINISYSARTKWVIPLNEIKLLTAEEVTTTSYQSLNFQMNGGRSSKANSNLFIALTILAWN